MVGSSNGTEWLHGTPGERLAEVKEVDSCMVLGEQLAIALAMELSGCMVFGERLAAVWQ